MAEDEMYLENLREFIIEEDKIITYKWLSRTLSVNVNQAKQMLYAFTQVQKEQKKENLNILYIVGGLMKSDNGHLIQKYLFSDERDLEDLKKCFDQLTSLHIYSVQKNKSKDSNILYTTDYDLQKQNIECSNRWSNITCKSATKRVVEVRDEQDNDVEHDENIESKSNATPGPVLPDPSASTGSRLPKHVASTLKKNNKTKGKPIKKGDVASFFARQTLNNNKDEKRSNEKEDEKVSEEVTKLSADDQDDEEKKQIGNDVLANENTKKEQKAKKKIDDKESKEETVNEQRDSDNKKNVKNSTKTGQESSPEEKRKKPTKKQQETVVEKKKRGVKRNKTKNSPKDKNDENDAETKRKSKKRRRVKNFSDSSSEEEAQVATRQEYQNSNSEDSASIPDQQPEEKMDTNDSNQKPQKARRRKRVLKSKTYLNEEGYMVTEKVYESESEECSDGERSPQAPDKLIENKTVVKETTKKAPVVKKKIANKQPKQASLTSFFKKS